jgi:hypothetical protein
LWSSALAGTTGACAATKVQRNNMRKIRIERGQPQRMMWSERTM